MPSGVTPESLRSGAPGFGQARLSCLSFPCPALGLHKGPWAVPQLRGLRPARPAPSLGDAGASGPASEPKLDRKSPRGHRAHRFGVLLRGSRHWTQWSLWVCSNLGTRRRSPRCPQIQPGSPRSPRGRNAPKAGGAAPTPSLLGHTSHPSPVFGRSQVPPSTAGTQGSDAQWCQELRKSGWGRILGKFCFFPLKHQLQKGPQREKRTQRSSGVLPSLEAGGAQGSFGALLEPPDPSSLPGPRHPPGTLYPRGNRPPLGGATQAQSSRWPRPG